MEFFTPQGPGRAAYRPDGPLPKEFPRVCSTKECPREYSAGFARRCGSARWLCYVRVGAAELVTDTCANRGGSSLLLGLPAACIALNPGGREMLVFLVGSVAAPPQTPPPRRAICPSVHLPICPELSRCSGVGDVRHETWHMAHKTYTVVGYGIFGGFPPGKAFTRSAVQSRRGSLVSDECRNLYARLHRRCWRSPEAKPPFLLTCLARVTLLNP